MRLRGGAAVQPDAPAGYLRHLRDIRQHRPADERQGRAGGNLFFTTDDCQKTYEDLLAKGVEFAEGPTDRGYGIDCGLRDPFGNYVRFSQMSDSFVSGKWQGATA